MKKKLLFLIVVLFFASSVLAWSDDGTLTQSVTGCGELNTTNGVYTLANTINNINVTCFDIKANNMTLNFNGFNINGTLDSGGGYPAQGIMDFGYNSLKIKNANITNFIYGIYLLTTSNNTIEDSYIEANLSSVYFETSNYNLIKNNTFKKYISAYGTSYDNFLSNTFISDTGISFSSSNNNLFKNTNILATGTGISFVACSNNIIQDSNLSGVTNDISITSSSRNNTLINVTYAFNKESVGFNSAITRKWYYQTFVNDTSGNLIPNANVFGYSGFNTSLFITTTNSSGWTPILELIDYTNSAGTKTNYNNNSIYAFNSTYIGSVSRNLTIEHNIIDTITISPGTFSFPILPIINITSCTTLTIPYIHYKLKNNLNSVGTCMYIGADNVNLDLNGFSITGSSTELSGGSGVYNLGYNNFVVGNGSISTFYEDIYLQGNSNNQIINMSLNNSYNAISLLISSDDLMKNVLINDSIFNIRLGSSSNITSINSTYNSSREEIGTGSTLTRKWYFDAQVNDTDTNLPIASAIVQAWNNIGTSQWSVLTDATGKIATQNLTEYITNGGIGGGTKTYYSNYTINASKVGYQTNSTSLNISDSSSFFFLSKTQYHQIIR